MGINKALQVGVVPRFSHFIKAEWEITKWRIGSQKLDQESGTGPDPTAVSPTNRESYAIDIDIQRA